jgi:F420-dependent oxidoreductase-like protein
LPIADRRSLIAPNDDQRSAISFPNRGCRWHAAPMAKTEFGVMLPQMGTSWSQVREVAAAAEEAGFDSVWAVDHFVGIPDQSIPVLEAWTALTAVAAITRRVRMGHLVLCVSYRNPALLAKMAATLDVISGGRFILGIGAGWHQQEYGEYGYEFPPIGRRLAQLDEALSIVRAMWTETDASFSGRHFSVRDAVCLPKPVQARLPILVGGGGEKVMLRLVARHADIWNNLGAFHGEVAHKRDVLAGHCRALGRDPAEIAITQQVLAAIATDRAEAARRTERIFAELAFLDGGPHLALTGMPDEIRARVERDRGLGVSGFIMSFGRVPDPEDLRLFSREVIAAYR